MKAYVIGEKIIFAIPGGSILWSPLRCPSFSTSGDWLEKAEN